MILSSLSLSFYFMYMLIIMKVKIRAETIIAISTVTNWELTNTSHLYIFTDFYQF